MRIVLIALQMGEGQSVRHFKVSMVSLINLFL